MSGLSYRDLLHLTLPAAIVVAAGLIALALDLTLLAKFRIRVRFAITSSIACAGCMSAALWIVIVQTHPHILQGMLLCNSLTQLMQVAILVLSTLTLLLSIDSSFTEHVGEYVFLILLATAGMMVLVGAVDLLLIFVSLELLSLCLYVLTGFDKRSVHSAEAALKYFLFGGMSAAFLLFGFSLLYGLAGSTNLIVIGAAFRGPSLDPLMIVAIVMSFVGFGFKVAAVPFHLWAPDTYQGAPTPAAAFIASASKVASFFVLSQLLVLGLPASAGSVVWKTYAPGWVPLTAVVAAGSIVLGNVAALAQTSVKRLLAYSAIAHAGYILVGIVARTEQSIAALIFYVLTYGLTTIGAFGVVSVVESTCGGDKLSDFAGLSRRAPLPSFCMMIFLLSLAGIPPLAGFFAKFYLFTAAVAGTPGSISLLWLVILGIAMSAVSLYYYLQVLKQIYVEHRSEGAGKIKAPMLTQIVLCFIAVCVLVLGCAPDPLMNLIQKGLVSLNF